MGNEPLKTETRTRIDARRSTSGHAAVSNEPDAPADDRPRIRLLVADGQAIDRTGLVALLRGQPDFLVVGEAATVPEALERCEHLHPDVVVLTLSLTGATGATALADLLAAQPELRVVALSERGWEQCLVLNPPARSELPIVRAPEAVCSDGTDCLQVAAAQGAMATLRRSADISALFAAIRTVAEGRTTFEPGTLPALAEERTGHGLGLTARETQVALLLAEGFSNKEIASALDISEPTVKKHVGQVLAKLGLQDRLQAGLYVARHPLMFAAGARRRAEARDGSRMACRSTEWSSDQPPRFAQRASRNGPLAPGGRRSSPPKPSRRVNGDWRIQRIATVGELDHRGSHSFDGRGGQPGDHEAPPTGVLNIRGCWWDHQDVDEQRVGR